MVKHRVRAALPHDWQAPGWEGPRESLGEARLRGLGKAALVATRLGRLQYRSSGAPHVPMRIPPPLPPLG